MFKINLFQTYALPSPNAFHPHLRETVLHFLPTPRMRRRQPPCAVAPKLSPAESKCMSAPKSSLAMRVADIRLAQNEICRVRAARGVALSALRWSTFGLLACARCTFLSRMVLPPQRGSHFAYLRGHERHLGLAKWSSRLRAVRILNTELSPACGAHFHGHL